MVPMHAEKRKRASHEPPIGARTAMSARIKSKEVADKAVRAPAYRLFAPMDRLRCDASARLQRERLRASGEQQLFERLGERHERDQPVGHFIDRPGASRRAGRQQRRRYYLGRSQSETKGDRTLRAVATARETRRGRTAVDSHRTVDR